MADEVQEAPKEITQEELVQDLQTIGNVVQQHDQSIFQIIASLNAIQAILLDKDLCQEKDLAEKTQEEAKILQEKIMAMVTQGQEAESGNEVKASVESVEVSEADSSDE